MTNRRQIVPEPDENVCRSVSDSSDVDAVDSDTSALIYEPRAVERPGGVIEIRGDQENKDVFAWGFWGGLLAVAAVAAPVVFGVSTGNSLWDVLLFAVVLLTGLALFKLGKRSRLEERLLCEVDTERQILSWPTTADSSLIAVTFDDVQEISFGIVRVPVVGSGAGTAINAATVRIVDDRGREIPVITASTSKGEAHKVARFFADLLDLSVDYVGTGVREWV